MSVEKKNQPGMVFTMPVTDKEGKIKNIPPKDKDPKDLKVTFMTKERLAEMEKEGSIMTIGKAGVLSPKETTKVKQSKDIQGDLPLETEQR